MGRRRFFYGWLVAGVAALAMVGTLPGRTQGLGLVTEPLLADLGLDRDDLRHAELLGDDHRRGRRPGRRPAARSARQRASCSPWSRSPSASSCASMSQVTRSSALAVAITLTRGLGQSALSVVSIAIVGHWFVRRINIAMAIYSVVLSVGFMIAFPVVGALVQSCGWRATWLAVGIALLAVLAPISWVVVRRSPEAIGLAPDGAADRAAATPAPADELSGHRGPMALSTGAFWVFALGTALYGLVASGIGLFNESILAERGFGPEVYYQTLVVTAMTALAGNFLGGWLATRMPLTRLMAISLFVLAGGLVCCRIFARSPHVMMWATAMGLGGGMVMVLFFSVWPAVFGRRHLGRIQGVAQALTVLASALGPLLLAWCIDLTGSYAAMFRMLSGVIATTAVAALVVDLPPPAVATLGTPQRAGP